MIHCLSLNEGNASKRVPCKARTKSNSTVELGHEAAAWDGHRAAEIRATTPLTTGKHGDNIPKNQHKAFALVSELSFSEVFLGSDIPNTNQHKPTGVNNKYGSPVTMDGSSYHHEFVRSFWSLGMPATMGTHPM